MKGPYNPKSETAALGGMLLSAEALDYCIEHLAADDFHSPANEAIFSCMKELHAKNTPVDLVSVIAELHSVGRLAMAGDAGYITGLVTQTPSASNFAYHVRRISECTVRRKLMGTCRRIMTDAQDMREEIPELLGRAEKDICGLMLEKQRDTLANAEDGLMETCELITRAMQRRGDVLGVQTGFADLDKMIAGFRNEELIIIAGRPAMGKSSFVMNIVQFAVKRRLKNVAVFSLEMPRTQLIMRMLSSLSGVGLREMFNGEMTDADKDKVAEARDELCGTGLYIDDSALATIPVIHGKCKRLKASKGLDMVVIDYLQLMRSPERIENRVLEVSEITRSAKLMAKDLRVPVVMLSQLSRAPEKRNSAIPVLSDLRDSGSIEQDADMVIMLYREKAYDKDANDTADVIVAKNRNGPTGTAKLYWDGAHTRFTDYIELPEGWR